MTGDDEIAGALMARLEWEGDAGFAWIDELGVLRPWRRQGIALALLRQASRSPSSTAGAATRSAWVWTAVA